MSGGKTSQSGQRSRVVKRLVIPFVVIAILAAGSVIAWDLLQPLVSAGSQVTLQTAAVQSGDLVIGVTASGTTVQGSVSQPVDSALAAHELEVEKVLVVSGNAITKGQALLKITDASLAAARADLADAVTDASVKLSQAEIDYASAMANAQSEQSANLALATTAKQQYQLTLDNLSSAVTQAKADRDADKSIIADYPAAIAAAESALKNLENEQAAAETALIQAQANLNTRQAAADLAAKAWSAAKSAAEQAVQIETYVRAYAAKNSALLAVDGEYAAFLTAVAADRLAADNALAAVEPAHLAAESALNQARDAVKTGESTIGGIKQQIMTNQQNCTGWTKDLEKAQSNLASDQLKYDQALNAQKTQSLTAEQQYQENLLVAKNAESLYAIAVQSAETSIASARQKASDAADDLASFEAAITDGTIIAQYDGTLSSIGYAAEDTLTASTALAVYVNAKLMTVQVTIDQTDIAGIAVGAEVPVTFSASRRSYTGIVATIATTSGATSVSDVNYAVTVRIDGDLTGLSSGLTATVSFIRETLANVLYLPEAAVHNGSSGSYVLKQENGKSVETTVTTGASNGTYIVITSGLAKDDTCVLPSTAKES